MTNDEKQIFNHLNDLPDGSVILTYSQKSYRQLTSLTTHKAYAYYKYGIYVSWPMEILFKTNSLDEVYLFLNRLEITHLFITEEDLLEIANGSENPLEVIMNFFKLDYSNSYGSVYIFSHSLNNSASNNLLHCDYPDDIFKLGYPSLINIYKLMGLNNYLYTLSDIILKGNISIFSNYIYLEDNLYGDLTIKNGYENIYYKKVILKKIVLSAPYNITLILKNGYLTDFNNGIIQVISPSLEYIKISIKNTPVNMTVNYMGINTNVCINNGSIYFSPGGSIHLRLFKPEIMINNGTLSSSLFGVFNSGERTIILNTNKYVSIEGKYAFKLLNDYDVKILKMNKIDFINIRNLQ